MGVCAAACGHAPATEATDTGVATADSDIARGKAFMHSRACPDCHQSPNASDGALSGQTTPLPFTKQYPANLTPDPETGLGDWLDVEIARAIRSGYAPIHRKLCDRMQHFTTMSDDEVRAIIAYLRSLPPVRRVIPASTCGDGGVGSGDADVGSSDGG